MLYTVIADYRKLLEEITNDEGEIVSPFSHFKSDLKEYIRRPKTKEGRLSRLGGYLLLYHTVRFLFGKINFEIGFTKEGKPYFSSEEMKDLSFSISHSGGLCAVCLCEDGASLGIDIQEEIDKEKEERISERLFSESLVTRELSGVSYLFGGFSAFGDCMFCEIPYNALKKGDTEDSITDKWTLSEGIMKCDGRGFGAFTELLSLSDSLYSETVKISYKGKSYSLSTVCDRENKVVE